MIRLSKKIEYAILAIQYIALTEGKIVSAKEISKQLNISFEFLSKTLQKLIRNDIITSQQGSRGGYVLSRASDKISIEDIINAIDEKTKLVECFEKEHNETCGRAESCSIRTPIGRIQHEINAVFRRTTVADISKIDLQILPKKLSKDNLHKDTKAK